MQTTTKKPPHLQEEDKPPHLQEEEKPPHLEEEDSVCKVLVLNNVLFISYMIIW